MTKRFWTEAKLAAEPGGTHQVLLDGRPVRLPSGAVLVLPNAALGQAVADEWQAVGSEFSQVDLPLTGLAGAAQERIAPARDAMAATLAAYAETDLLCYRVETPANLADAQAAGWQPWLDWAATRYGARLHATYGLAHLPQPVDSLAKFSAAIAARTDPELAALGLAIPALGSCVLGLALADGAIAPLEAADLACLDERHQAAHWGEDADAASRRVRLAGEIALAARFMEMSRLEGTVAARRLIVSGRVQGVGYRAWAERTAQALGLAGWVRNRRDGTVELLLDGPSAAVEEMTEACRLGPRHAEVAGIETFIAGWPKGEGFQLRETF